MRFRFRLATDASISREGWYVDDVRVQSCQAPLEGDLQLGLRGRYVRLQLLHRLLTR